MSREKTENFRKKELGQIQVGKGTKIRRAPIIGESIPKKVEIKASNSELLELFWTHFPKHKELFYRIKSDYAKFLRKLKKEEEAEDG